MFNDNARAGQQPEAVLLSSKEAAQLAFEILEEDVLMIATNILRATLERKDNPRFGITNQNAVLLAYYTRSR